MAKWFNNFADKAELLLNNIDQSAAEAISKKTITPKSHHQPEDDDIIQNVVIESSFKNQPIKKVKKTQFKKCKPKVSNQVINDEVWINFLNNEDELNPTKLVLPNSE